MRFEGLTKYLGSGIRKFCDKMQIWRHLFNW